MSLFISRPILGEYCTEINIHSCYMCQLGKMRVHVKARYMRTFTDIFKNGPGSATRNEVNIISNTCGSAEISSYQCFNIVIIEVPVMVHMCSEPQSWNQWHKGYHFTEKHHIACSARKGEHDTSNYLIFPVETCSTTPLCLAKSILISAIQAWKSGYENGCETLK